MIQLRHVNSPRHPIMSFTGPIRWPHFADGLGEATDAIIAYDPRRCQDRPAIVGWFRWWGDQNPVVAAGTWVRPNWRHRGIAVALWHRALTQHIEGLVDVTTMSESGEALVSTLRKEFPGRLLWTPIRRF